MRIALESRIPLVLPLPILVVAAVISGCKGSEEPKPTLLVTPSSLSFTAAPTAAPLQLSVTSSGKALTWAALDDATWLTMSNIAGSTPASVDVNVDATAMAGGNLAGRIKLTAVGASNDSVVVPAALIVPHGSGTWSGTSSGVTMTALLTEANGVITGSGSLAAVSSLSVTITGTHSHPTVTLTLAAAGYNPCVFTGTFTAVNTLQGALNGSGFVNWTMTLTRQVSGVAQGAGAPALPPGAAPGGLMWPALAH